MGGSPLHPHPQHFQQLPVFDDQFRPRFCAFEPGPQGGDLLVAANPLCILQRIDNVAYEQR
jgi:hypothetical protein